MDTAAVGTGCAHKEASFTILPQMSFFDMSDPTSHGPPVMIKGHPMLGLSREREHFVLHPSSFVLTKLLV